MGEVGDENAWRFGGARALARVGGKRRRRGRLGHLDIVAHELGLLDEALLDLQGPPRVAERQVDGDFVLELLLHALDLLARVERVIVLAASSCDLGEIPIAEALPELRQKCIRDARRVACLAPLCLCEVVEVDRSEQICAWSGAAREAMRHENRNSLLMALDHRLSSCRVGRKV